MNVDDLHDFDFLVFIIGTAIFVFLPIIGYQHHMDWISPFASVGPLYIGYKSKSYLQAFLVGGISGLFLSIAVIYGYLGAYTTPIFGIVVMNILLIIICFIFGGFISVVGEMFNNNKTKAMEMAEAEKKGTKNVKVAKRPIEPAMDKIKRKFGKK